MSEESKQNQEPQNGGSGESTPEELRNNPGRTPGKAEGEEDAGEQSRNSGRD